MNYNLQDVANPSRNFAARFTSPLHEYIVGPRKPEDAPYLVDIDFRVYPLLDFLQQYAPTVDDVLEIFWLTRRVQLQAVKIEVVNPAPVVFRPVTNTNMAVFVEVDCSEPHETTYVVNGGVLTGATKLLDKAIVIDDPDYLGLRVESGAEYLPDLALRVQLVVDDRFPWNMQTNSAKKDGFGR